MAKLSRADFLDYLNRSRLLSDAQVKEFLDSTPADADSEQLAKALVDQKLINQWHADNLLKAKYRGFTLGKYRLLGHPLQPHGHLCVQQPVWQPGEG